MEKNFLFMSLVASTFVLTACQNNDLPVTSFDSSFNNEEFIESGHYSFIYKGELYDTKYKVKEDSTVIFDNSKVQAFFDEYFKSKSASSFIYEDVVYLFDNEEEACKYLSDLESSQEKQTRVVNKYYIIKSASLTIYEDNKYKGKSKSYNTTTKQLVDNDLGTSGLDKKVSSYKFTSTYNPVEIPTPNQKTNYQVIFYSDKNCKGFSTVKLFNYKSPNYEQSNFKDLVPFGPYLNQNWNDKARSLKINVIQ